MCPNNLVILHCEMAKRNTLFLVVRVRCPGAIDIPENSATKQALHNSGLFYACKKFGKIRRRRTAATN
jgi:hypothetical protein